jgi:hypothetical protein
MVKRRVTWICDIDWRTLIDVVKESSNLSNSISNFSCVFICPDAFEQLFKSPPLRQYVTDWMIIDEWILKSYKLLDVNENSNLIVRREN